MQNKLPEAAIEQEERIMSHQANISAQEALAKL